MLEADKHHCMVPHELYMAMTAWLALRDPAAATQRWHTHRALLAQWTHSQQQDVFQQALQLAQELPAAWQMAEQACLLGAAQQVSGRAHQTHALVQARLTRQQREAAFQVSKLSSLQRLSAPSAVKCMHLAVACWLLLFQREWLEGCAAA